MLRDLIGRQLWMMLGESAAGLQLTGLLRHRGARVHPTARPEHEGPSFRRAEFGRRSAAGWCAGIRDVPGLSTFAFLEGITSLLQISCLQQSLIRASSSSLLFIRIEPSFGRQPRLATTGGYEAKQTDRNPGLQQHRADPAILKVAETCKLGKTVVKSRRNADKQNLAAFQMHKGNEFNHFSAVRNSYVFPSNVNNRTIALGM